MLVGAGGLGLSGDRGAEGAGAPAIVSVDVSAEKRQAALEAGATKVVDGSGEGVTERIVAACGGPAQAVIDLVNGTATAAFAFAALRKGGKLIQVGLFGGELTLPLPMMAMRGLTVQGSYVGNPKELRELVALAQDGKLPPMPITRCRRRGERGADAAARREGDRPDGADRGVEASAGGGSVAAARPAIAARQRGRPASRRCGAAWARWRAAGRRRRCGPSRGPRCP